MHIDVVLYFAGAIVCGVVGLRQARDERHLRRFDFDQAKSREKERQGPLQ